MQRIIGKQQNRESQRSPQENWRLQGNISCQDEHKKGKKWYGPNRSKGEKERYTPLNAEFQRIAKRDEKAFINDQ